MTLKKIFLFILFLGKSLSVSVGEFLKKLSVSCRSASGRVGELVFGEKVPSLSCRVGQLSVGELS